MRKQIIKKNEFLWQSLGIVVVFEFRDYSCEIQNSSFRRSGRGKNLNNKQIYFWCFRRSVQPHDWNRLHFKKLRSRRQGVAFPAMGHSWAGTFPLIDSQLHSRLPGSALSFRCLKFSYLCRQRIISVDWVLELLSPIISFATCFLDWK